MPEPLGQLQLQVMEEVWRRGLATVAQVHRELAKRRKIAYTTVLTTMQGLERRGMVRHEQAGKAYVFHPTITREEYTKASVNRLVHDLFGGEREALLCHLLGAGKITHKELEEIRKMVARASEQERKA